MGRSPGCPRLEEGLFRSLRVEFSGDLTAEWRVRQRNYHLPGNEHAHQYNDQAQGRDEQQHFHQSAVR